MHQGSDGPDRLEALVRAQQKGCAIGGSVLYTGLLDAVADDVRSGGPCRAVLAPHVEEPAAHAVVLRFLAAVHALALDGSAPGLAAHYPSCGGRPGPGVGEAFVAAVEADLDRVRAGTAAPLQTNEVGRSAALLGGYLAVARAGLPLRVLEVGASAGLNLRFDHFRYEHRDAGPAGEDGCDEAPWGHGSGRGGPNGGRGAVFGPAGSPVRFVDPWTGRAPGLDVAVEVVERRGCDLRPLDPADPAHRLQLRASLWPDQEVRRHRLDGALAVAAAVPAPVERADAAAWAAERLAEPVPGAATVVAHAIVAQYLSPEGRRDLEEAVARAGGRATVEAPVAWLRMEPADDREAEVRLTRWPAPAGVPHPPTEVLARSAFHGPPVRWLDLSP